MSQAGIDIQVIAERVAEAVNRKLGQLAERVEDIERRVRELELSSSAIRSQTIESIVKAVFSVKVDEALSSVTSAMRKFSGDLSHLPHLSDELKQVVNSISDTTSAIGQINKKLEEISKTLSDLLKKPTSSPSLKDLSGMAKMIGALSNSVSGLKSTINNLSAKFDDLLGQLSVVNENINKMRDEVRNLQDSVNYIRQVSGVIDQRLRARESISEEE